MEEELVCGVSRSCLAHSFQPRELQSSLVAVFPSNVEHLRVLRQCNVLWLHLMEDLGSPLGAIVANPLPNLP